MNMNRFTIYELKGAAPRNSLDSLTADSVTFAAFIPISLKDSQALQLQWQLQDVVSHLLDVPTLSQIAIVTGSLWHNKDLRCMISVLFLVCMQLFQIILLFKTYLPPASPS